MAKFKVPLTIILVVLLASLVLGLIFLSIVQSQELKTYKNKVVVLMYHQLDPNPQDSSIITPEQFEEQLIALKQGGYNVISMDQYMTFKLEGRSIPDNAVLITFDDGYENFYNYAYPILKKHELTATNFVIVSPIDQRELNGIKKLNWDQMREMKKSGMSFYSHTYDSHKYVAINQKGKLKPMLSHRMYLTEQNRMETKEEYISRVFKDLKLANQRLKEELGNTYALLAYPYGSYNKDVDRICESQNINLTFSVRKGINTKNNPRTFRINAGNQQISSEKLIKKINALSMTFHVILFHYITFIIGLGVILFIGQRIIKLFNQVGALFRVRKKSN